MVVILFGGSLVIDTKPPHPGVFRRMFSQEYPHDVLLR